MSDTVTISGFDSSYLGTKGLITAFIAAFVTCGIYHFCISHHITIKMPKEVPPNISQAFLDLIPLSLSTVVFWLFDQFFRSAFSTNFAAAVIGAFQPLFSAAETYPGLALIYGMMAFFWFVGVHGPSIVEPAITAPALLFLSDNLASYQAGQQAAHVLTPGLQYFVATLGGTGATLVITLMFAFMAKSKEMKAIGRASSVPVLFGVNEPILFGAPLILNPVFFVPFIITPILNVWLFKIFVDVLGMNGFIYLLPWTTPGPLAVILGTGVAPLSFLFVPLVLALDFVVYYPFFKVYDKQMCEQESETAAEEKLEELEESVTADEAKAEAETASAVTDVKDLDGKKVLVLCAGGGTSGLLANALDKAGKERGINVISAAGSYGTHLDIMGDYDLVVLAPQVASYLPDLEKDAARMGVQVAACQGKQYIALTRDGDAALKFVADELSKGKE
jgi:PTS system lactose-specific IIC component